MTSDAAGSWGVLNDHAATFRATEFTTGSLGPQAMRADMSPTTAHTYAADFSIDEAARPQGE